MNLEIIMFVIGVLVGVEVLVIYDGVYRKRPFWLCPECGKNHDISPGDPTIGGSHDYTGVDPNQWKTTVTS